MPDKFTDIARKLRKQLVPAETLLWRALRNRALGGFKFRRQYPIAPYVVDFACVEVHVVIEADGVSHLVPESSDKGRSDFLEANGWHVLRFWNTEIFDDMEAVKEAIYRECKKRSDAPHTAPLAPGTPGERGRG